MAAPKTTAETKKSSTVPKEWLIRKTTLAELDQRFKFEFGEEFPFSRVLTEGTSYAKEHNNFVDEVRKGGEIWSWDNRQWPSGKGKQGFVLIRDGVQVSGVVTKLS